VAQKVDSVKLHAYYEEHPDSYLEAAAKVFGCSTIAIFKARKRLGITRKKLNGMWKIALRSEKFFTIS